MPENTIKKIVEISVNSEKVFQAITDEAQLKKWWVDVPQLEKRIDGKILFRFLKDKSELLTEDFVVEGKVKEYIPNHKLAYTWKPSGDLAYPDTLVTWTLEEVEKNKTKLTLHHSGLENAPDAARLDEGWSYFLNRLVQMFQN